MTETTPETIHSFQQTTMHGPLYAAFARAFAEMKLSNVISGGMSRVVCQWGDGPCAYGGGCQSRCARSVRE